MNTNNNQGGLAPSKTPSAYQRFYALVDHYPQLSYLWDKDNDAFDFESADRLRAKLSSSERVILDCLRSIWRGGAHYDDRIDFTDLANLDPESRLPLANWIINPFFP